MIATRRFVFLHLHKSGGTFVNQFLLRFFPDAKLIGYHLPRAWLPAKYNGLPMFGLVRNPWDFYVSWYNFQRAGPAHNVLFDCASDGGQLDFQATTGNLLTLGGNPGLLRRILSRLPDHFTGSGINLTRGCLAQIAGKRHGFYSFMFHRMYGDDEKVVIGKMELLRHDLMAFLRSCGVTLSTEMSDHIRSRERTNVSVHASRVSLYGDALRNQVAECDAEIVRRFDYRFESREPAGASGADR